MHWLGFAGHRVVAEAAAGYEPAWQPNAACCAACSSPMKGQRLRRNAHGLPRNRGRRNAAAETRPSRAATRFTGLLVAGSRIDALEVATQQ